MLNRDKLKQRRTELNVKPKDIAFKLGITYPTYFKKEQGVRTFNDYEIPELFKLLRIPEEEWYTYFLSDSNRTDE